MTMVLLTLRFILELALFTTVGVMAAQLSATGWLRWALALGAVSVTVLVWGTLLSPRRRIDLPLPLRVTVELTLFTVTAVALAWSGHLIWAVALLVTELTVIAALWRLGLPPGSHATASDGGVRGV